MAAFDKAIDEKVADEFLAVFFEHVNHEWFLLPRFRHRIHVKSETAIAACIGRVGNGDRAADFLVIGEAACCGVVQCGDILLAGKFLHPLDHVFGLIHDFADLGLDLRSRQCL